MKGFRAAAWHYYIDARENAYLSAQRGGRDLCMVPAVLPLHSFSAD